MTTWLARKSGRPIDRKVAVIFFEFGAMAPVYLVLSKQTVRLGKYPNLLEFFDGRLTPSEVVFSVRPPSPLRGLLFISGGSSKDMVFGELEKTTGVGLFKVWRHRVQKMQELIDFLKERGVELVVIDGPAGGGPDDVLNYMALLMVSTHFVPVVQPGQGNIDSAEDLVDRATLSGVDVPMVVVNNFGGKEDEDWVLRAATLLPPSKLTHIIAIPISDKVRLQYSREPARPAVLFLDTESMEYVAFEQIARAILKLPEAKVEIQQRLQAVEEVVLAFSERELEEKMPRQVEPWGEVVEEEEEEEEGEEKDWASRIR